MQKCHSNIQIRVHFNLTHKCSKTQQKFSQISTLLIYYYVKKLISIISFYNTGLILPLLTTACFIYRQRRNIFQLILSGEKHIGKRNSDIWGVKDHICLFHANKFNSKDITVF